jgi:DNA-binding NarL/FixJ family response regulator
MAGEPGAPAAGEASPEAESAGHAGELPADDRKLVLLMTEGLTNAEMAERLGTTEAAVSIRLAEIMVAMGATHRAQATSLAMRGLGATLPAGGGQGHATA